MRKVQGSVKRVYDERISLKGEKIIGEVEDNIAAVLEWPTGLVATVRSNWCTAMSKADSHYEVKFYGSDGIIFLNPISPQNPLIVYSPKRVVPGAKKVSYAGFSECYLPDLAASADHKDIVDAFARAIISNRPMPSDGCSVHRQLHVIEVIDKLYSASKQGTAMRVESEF